MTHATSPAREESSALFLQGEMQAIIKSKIGMHDDFAAMVASAVVEGLRERAGGQSIYIPTSTDFKTRDEQIKREFNGTNRADVCRKHNISRSRLYQIVGS